MKCQCEQITCEHKQTCCTKDATQEVRTIYGKYLMCDQCANALPHQYIALRSVRIG